MSDWHVIVVEASEKPLRAFLAGFQAGRGVTDAVLFGQDLDIESAPLSRWLRDLFVPGAHHLLLAPADCSDALWKALRANGEEAGLRPRERSIVKAASLRFSLETFSQKVATELRATFETALPPGVSVEDLQETEERDAEAHGVELYAPTHDYTFRATGRLVGALPGVLEMQRRARNRDFVRTEPLRIETEPIPEKG